LTDTPFEIGVYYFPNYHADPRNEALYGAGWTEWELLRKATPRYPGHRQPRVPTWGYEDEADPRVFAKKIAAAADHGITQFIFDWYWYEDGPFLQRCLEEGYLQASNRERLQFSLMWANHTWLDIMPTKRSTPPRPLYAGKISAAAFETMTDYIVDTYFRVPTYWKIDGAPYFSVYELFMLVDSLGGVQATREALDRFRAKTRRAGFPDLHLNAVIWGVQLLPGETAVSDPRTLLQALGFDSVTSYVWIHHVQMPSFPETSYTLMLNHMVNYWQTPAVELGLPYFPNVTMGWDSSPRTAQSDVYENLGYPFLPIMSGNTPQHFQRALEQVKQFLEQTPGARRIFNINAWNEWTEGSYLEPDTEYGMAYLEAIHQVFVSK
jgi:hypothetical protein